MWAALYVSGLANATGLNAPAVAEVPNAPHIALLLPLKSPAFRTAAGAVQQGFLAASGVGKATLPVRVYGCADEGKEILALYAQAIANGAQAVAGPLTRNGVNLLAAQSIISVPTLALNSFDAQPATPMYGFGMAVEAEARLIAHLAAENGLHHAVVIHTQSPLDLRLLLAFEDAWTALGGKIEQEIDYKGESSELGSIKYQADTLIFLASNAQNARTMRPYLPKKMPIYATSQLFSNNNPTNFELNGIRFVDMPWLLQPDHPSVLVYPRANPALSTDMERLYALGIDAYRLLQWLLQPTADTSLHGVSGEIQLNGHQFLRAAVPARFVQGQAQLLSSEEPHMEVLFPAQTKP